MNAKELAARWFTAIDKKDLGALKGMLDPHHRFHNPMTPAPADGEGHLGLIQMMTAALQGSHILDRLIAEGDAVAVRGRWQGKHVGEFNGVPATGKSIEFTFTDILSFRDGKLADEWMEMNPMAIMAQIGGGK